MAEKAAGAWARLAAILLLGLLPCHPTVAQEGPPVVVVIDQEQLFQRTLFGQRIAQELEQRSAALATENRAIEAELVAEERDLTERRAELEPSEFRSLADAFDAKVERLRAEQDAKTRELVATRDAERQNFTRLVGPILLSYMRSIGAEVMLDRRSVVASADRVDVTDALVAAVDAEVGSGVDAEEAGGTARGTSDAAAGAGDAADAQAE